MIVMLMMMIVLPLHKLLVTGRSNSSVAGSSTYNSNFTSVTGTYGTLKVGADGTYTYVADQSRFR